MLNFLRKKSTMKIILWIIVVVVVVSFVFWGFGRNVSGPSRRYKYAGIMYGKRVPIDEYAASYEAVYRQALLTYGNNLPKIIDSLNIQQQAWDRLLLIHEADRQGIKVTDKEVVETIRSIPLFQEDGTFSQERYELILNKYLKTQPRHYEEEIRNGLKISELIEGILDKVDLSDQELLQRYKEENEKVKVSYALIEANNYKDKINPSEEELQAFYRKNQEAFRTPPMVNISYISATVADTLEEATVTDEEIASFYEKNKDLYVITPEEAADAPEEQQEPETEYKPLDEVKEQIRTNIQNAKAKDLAYDIAIDADGLLREGASFKDAADKTGLQIKETGYFSASESIPDIGWNFQFLNTAFSLDENEVSGITELPNGYYILKLLGRKDSYIPDFAEVKESVKDAFINEASFELAEEQAQAYLQEAQGLMQNNASAREALKELGLELTATDFFARADYVKGVGKSDDFIKAGFNLEADKISRPAYTQKGYALLIRDDFKPFNEEEFEEEKEKFRQKVLQLKKLETYQDWMESLKNEAKIESFLK